MVDRGEPEVWLLCNASSSRLPLMLLQGGISPPRELERLTVPSNKDVSQFDQQ